MKRICIGLLTALGCIAVATALIARPFSKKSIQSYVLRNQDELTNYARKVIEEHPMGPLEWNGWKVYYYADDMFPVRRGCLKKCMEAQYQFSVYDASHEKIGQEDIENRKEMYGDNLTDAQLDQLETICDKINAAQYHTIWYRALQLDQSEDGGNLLSETMVQYWNDEITLDELVDRLTPRLKLYLDE